MSLLSKLASVFEHEAVAGCQQAGSVASRSIVTGSNTRMNAAIVPNASLNNIVMRPMQSTVVIKPAPSSAVQPAQSVVGAGRIIAPSSTAASMPRPIVPANASVAGVLSLLHWFDF